MIVPFAASQYDHYDQDNRKLLSTKRARGTVVEWFGDHGWIEPAFAVEHRLAAEQAERIYVAGEDVDTFVQPGLRVTFFLYANSSVLGAMDVRPCEGDEASAGACGPFSGRSIAETAEGPEAVPQQRRPPTHRDDAIARAQQALFSGVWEAAQPVLELTAERSGDVLAKRVTKYLNKALHAPELLSLPWREAAELYVENAMSSFSSACSDQPWFFELDLAGVLGAGVWELLKANTSLTRCGWKAIERVATQRYEAVMDDVLLKRAMWDSIKAVLVDDPLCNKVFKFLQIAREAALARALEEGASRSLRPAERVELFVREWVRGCVHRCVQSLSFLVKEEEMLSLFQNLMAPFGEDHPFSCVPMALTQRIGRPPHDWGPLRRSLRDAFHELDVGGTASFAERSTDGSSAKRRRV
eukprot:TRINITY_DN29733_c0_g1_i2.p2 TRINITY_DN29733_c0_g1~~TRINITY_DN29733_c0_g1_i2.p2  ORF type:complete len:413 (-),score=85.14 TRINITY_DN29733_c0_g1_i2:6-1244(-)